MKNRGPGNRSSVSSEGFCENEDDPMILTQNIDVAGSSVNVETFDLVLNTNANVVSSSVNNKTIVAGSSNNNVNMIDNANNSIISSSSSSSGNISSVNNCKDLSKHNFNNTDSCDSSNKVRSNNLSSSTSSSTLMPPQQPSQQQIEAQALKSQNVKLAVVANAGDDEDCGISECGAVGGEIQGLDSSISSSSSSSSSQSNDSASFRATFERDISQNAVDTPKKVINDPKPCSSKDDESPERKQERRASKDESFSSSESQKDDDYSVYYYEEQAVKSLQEDQDKIEASKLEDANNTKYPVFSNVRPTEDAWDILFARAEGLHAHGHDREACTLGIRLAEELLANPPNLMIDIAPPVKRKGKKHNVNPIFHQISVLASQTLAKCAFLCTVLSENSEHYHLAFRVCLFGLEMARPPASTKPLEVKLNNQESDLLGLLKRIPLGHEEMKIIREKAEHLRDGTLKCRGHALLPIMLASFIFDALVLSNAPSKEQRPKISPACRLPTDEQLGFEAAVAALGLKANVAESEHPLLCEGTRRQRGDLALTLLYHYKDEPRNICRIMEKLLDREVHTLTKTPLLPSYYSNNPPIRTPASQLRLEEERAANELAANDLNVNSRPQSSTSAELDGGMSALNLNCYAPKAPTNQTMVTSAAALSTRTKEGRYKGKRSYPCIPNQPSEAGAHFIFELAKNVLIKAGGTSSTSLFTQVSTNNNHHGPHRALHMCAFQLGLYALGLHNCVSSNWLSRTYSSHVSWIMGQAMEIGAPAISFLIDTWEGHLTPPEAAGMADRASSRGWDSNMVYPAAELALSVLPHAAALNPSEIQRAILQCKEQSDMMLERACITVENAAKGGGVYPEVLFQVARYWYELYLRNTSGGDLEPEEQNDYFNVNLLPLIESGEMQAGAQANPTAPIPPVVVAANPPPPAPYPQQNMNSVTRIGIQPFVPFNYPIQGIYPNIPFHPNQMPMYISQPQFPYGPQQAKPPPMYNNSGSYPPISVHAPVPNQNFSQMPVNQPQQYQGVQPPVQQVPVPGPNGGPMPQNLQYFNPNMPVPPPPQHQQNQPPQQQQQPQPMRQGMHQHNPIAPNGAGIGNFNPQYAQQPPLPAQQGPQVRQRHPHQFSPTQLRYLLAAYNVGMLALETLARRVHDDRPQAKYARNPPYGDDIKWLLRISKRLGTQYLHQFCVCVVNSIVSPFILHEVAIEAAHYLARNNPALVLQHLRSALSPLVQKCQQMYIQSIHQKLYHLTTADYEMFTSTILSARNAFQITPDGPQQFKDWLQTIRRSKSCKKELWTQINNALQSGSK